MVYVWVVYLHVASVFLFLAVHGISIGIVLKLRRERNPQRIAVLLELSRSSIGFIHFSVLLVLATGIALGFLGGWWGRLWIWVALTAFIMIWGIMGTFGTKYYDRVRRAVGVAPFYGFKSYQANPEVQPDVAAVGELLSSNRPIVLILLGVVGLGIMLWLMVFKPF